MKYTPRFTYTFTPASFTLDLSSPNNSGFNVKGLLAVINVTSNTLIYAQASAGLGYSSISGGNILTLQYNTASMNAADLLNFIYDDGLPSFNDLDTIATGTITATDAIVAAPGGTGAFVSGTSTAGSYVYVACSGGDSAWNIQITGLTSGTLYFEGSLDSTTGIDGNWISVNGRQTGVVNTNLSNYANTNGMYRGNTSGLKYVRVRSVGALTGTPAIVIRISDGVGAVFLNAGLPPGSDTIGNIKVTDGTNIASVKPASTAPVVGDSSLVVTPHPSGIHYIQGVQSANTTGSITTAASVVGPLTVTNFNVITVGVYGVYAGVTFVFEATPDGTNWFIVQGSRVDNAVVGTGLTTATNTSAAWDIPIGAWTQFRVRATAWTSGTASIFMGAQTLPYDPAPAAIAQGTTPTGTALLGNTPVLIGGGSAGGGTNAATATIKPASTGAVATDTALVTIPHPLGAFNIQGAPQTSSTAGLTAAIASATGTVNTTAICVAAVGTAGNATMTFKGTFSGTFAFEVSDDNGTTWYPYQAVRSIDGFLSNSTGAITTIQLWNIACPGITHLRVRCSTYVSGTATVLIVPGGFLYAPSVSLTGDTPAGLSDTGNNPLKFGGIARLTNPTAVADGQRVAAIFDKLGKQIVVGAIRDRKQRQVTSISTVAETTIITAGQAGVFNDIYGLIITNISATAVYVTIKEATAGTTVMTIEVPAADTRGLMLPVDSAIPQTNGANNWTATLSAAVTSINITALYVQNL